LRQYTVELSKLRQGKEVTGSSWFNLFGSNIWNRVKSVWLILIFKGSLEWQECKSNRWFDSLVIVQSRWRCLGSSFGHWVCQKFFWIHFKLVKIWDGIDNNILSSLSLTAVRGWNWWNWNWVGEVEFNRCWWSREEHLLFYSLSSSIMFGEFIETQLDYVV